MAKDYPDPCEYCPLMYLNNDLNSDCRKNCKDLKEAVKEWAKEKTDG